MRYLTLLLVLSHPLFAAPQDSDLLTVAESSDWKSTGYHKDVMAFVDALAKKAPDVVRLGELGKTSEGKVLPLVIMARPPVANAEEARRSGKLIAYAQGGIHSGECCGKEALQMLAREIATTPNHPLLRNLVVVFAPIYNADGNDNMRPNNRGGQDGPENGMGTRATAEGYDLNRDNTKLDSPEAQSLSRFLNEWDPHLTIDTHTTNGSRHRNTLTFDGPVNPAGDSAIIDFVRDTLLPSVSKSVEEETGYLTTYYGNYNGDKSRWSTYEGNPRFGTRSRGIRGIISVLTEAYSYAPYKDRVLCTKAFVEHLLNYVADNEDQIRSVYTDVRERTVAKGNAPAEDDLVPLRVEVAKLPDNILIHGWVERLVEGEQGAQDRRGGGRRGGQARRGGQGRRGQGRRGRGRGGRARRVITDEETTYEMEHWGAYTSTLSVRRPFAYAYPASLTKLTEKLRQHGIEVETLDGSIEVAAEIYKLTSIQKAARPFQGHNMNTVELEARQESRTVSGGSMLVRTGHHLGNLIVYLLEPQATDGLTAWNLLDDVIAEGEDYPVIRIMKPINR